MTTVEYLLQHLPELSDNQLKHEYLNYLKWTEAIAQMLQQLDEESQALRVVRLETNFRDFEIPSRSRDLEQENSEVRFNAAHALGEIGSENAIATLSQALTHNNVSIRTLAMLWLLQLWVNAVGIMLALAKS